jgi:hypothetical protein
MEQRVVTLLPEVQFAQAPGAAFTIAKDGSRAYLLFRFPNDVQPSQIVSARLRLTRITEVTSASKDPGIEVYGTSESTTANWNGWEANKTTCLPKRTTCLAVLPPRNGVDGTVEQADLTEFLQRRTAPGRGIALLLAPQATYHLGREYYPSRPADKGEDSGKQPRLIVTYTVPAQRTAAAREVSDGWPNARSSVPLLFLAPLPGAFVSGPPADDAAALESVLRPASPPAIPSNIEKQVLGPEGNSYIVGGGNLYAVNHAGRMLWLRKVGASADWRMTLSPNGWYLYAVGTIDRTPLFYAINTATGEIRNPLPKPPKSVQDLQGSPITITSFHNPVVAYNTEGADYVFLSANSDEKASLVFVKNRIEQNDPTAAPNLDPPQYIRGAGSQLGQPIITTGSDSSMKEKKLYVVMKTAAATAAVASLDFPFKDPASLTAGADFGPASSGLWRKENPVIDGDGNIIFYDNRKLVVLAAKDRKSVVPIPFDASANLQLAFGSSGRLYTRDEAGKLLLAIPSFPAAESLVLSPVDAEITGRVAGKTLVVKAAGNIFLVPGFAVDLKAGLECRVGVAQAELKPEVKQ